ncbi:TPA: PhzF family phenazine biosynthesis protein [Enterobacter cloacae]|uniref:PhzF family phenazine biosynthesis protein n=1 Tax=Enterobacter pasteurii TaxID=3029761 RepID=A0ABR9QA54_9ENTR|nr:MULTISPECIES: PhzF family phenazine biosynthesis protein [Enterobacter cloacae complex]MBE4855728.1 PhzF family phenazine biosynthesis protein [Enterobacter pasteurii]MBE4861809.1 PhzF family phenazine biosynthesis protein [Enterobacter cloacae complex sp. P40C2]MBE4877769.1 PhzF family phenazine biosynthesis protein [Enterobacter cloacae complex sp. P40C]HBI6861673.1 PhzF family phenazine biosynthesis protein [Enterobacter pasteurii]
MKRRYIVADVFTDTPFLGNPVAVVLDAEGMSAEQMQQVAVEFGYSETTFVLPPENDSCTARVRIFTPSREIPFAGHPNVGTAYVLGRNAMLNGKTLPDTLHFEEIAGRVPVRLLTENNVVTGAELLVPEALTCRSEVSAENVAACLSLSPDDIRTKVHKPVVASVGLPFLIAELTTRDALRRCVPNLQGFRAILPLDGAVSVYAYTLDKASDENFDLQARMFTPRMTEDPATGSATAAATALLALHCDKTTLSLKVSQGVDMGRASVLFAEYDASSGEAVVRVGGKCVITFEGTFTL